MAPRKYATALTISILFLMLTACGSSGEHKALQTSPTIINPPPSSTFTPVPPTLTPVPSETPTSTPSPTHTSTPTPTATPPFPLSIEYLRIQAYDAESLTVEEVLPNGANYSQFIVSYLSEGLKIRALLTIPFGDPPENGWPAIVFNHGYIPPDVYKTTERYVAYVAGFATNGYVVLRPDYRGHDQSEGQARGAYSRPDYVIDVLNATAALKAHPEVDPNRVGMWGHSMGGYITLRAMVTDPEIRAGVIWAGVVGPYPNIFNRDSFSIDATPTSSGRGQWRLDLFKIFGTPEENPEFWESLSANYYLSDLSGPVQIHHGTADTSVPYSVSELLFDQLQAAGRPAEFHGYPGDNHNLSIAFSLAMQRSIQFFDKHVKNP